MIKTVTAQSEHRQGIEQPDGDALRIGNKGSQCLGPVGQVVTFVQQVTEDFQFLVTHGEELHAGLCIPGGLVEPFLEHAVGLIDTGRFVSSLQTPPGNGKSNSDAVQP